MVHLPVVFGEWVMRGGSWHFEVDKTKGGRMFFLEDGCTYGDLVGMALEDYKLSKEDEVLLLSYPLPDSMLKEMPTDTPPNFISNDRQVSILMKLIQSHVVRLCVSTRSESDTGAGGGDGHVDGHGHGDADGDENDTETDDDDDDVDVDDMSGVKDEDIVDGGMTGVKAEEYDSDGDYGVYGRLEAEAEEYEYDARFDVGGARLGGAFANWTDKIRVGESFSSKAELVMELRNTALMEKFSFKVYKSRPELFVAKCRVKTCKWRVRAIVTNEANKFFVTVYSNVHTCRFEERILNRKACNPKHIAKLFVDHFGLVDKIVPKHIQVSMGTLFGLKMDYTTAYRAMIFAQELVRGTAEEGYDKLPSYLQLIESSNPGTITDLVRDGKNQFKYLFLSFAASINGFQYMRRVIVVDGTHLNGKYEGVLLVAAGQDANFQVFPLAFGIVDSECDASWEWFFNNLKRCFSDEYPMTIVSDRHSSIAKACATVMPWATRGICYYHLQHNIVSRFRGRHIMYLVKGAAYAYTVSDYNHYMDAIRGVKESLATYLEEADPRLWSRVHFPGERYNIKTSNIAESLNSVLKVAKGFPIIYLAEFIREKLGSWFYKRREDALSLTTLHSRGVEKLLAIRNDYAERMTVQRIDGSQFSVRGRKTTDCMVNLEARTCTCGMFQVEKIPCSHAIAAANSAGVPYGNFVETLYGKNYLYATYSGNIYPIEGEAIAEDIPMRPPVVKIAPGRKKKSRWQSWLEMSRRRGTKPRKLHKQYNCSKCNQPGHTRPRCVSFVHIDFAGFDKICH